MAGLFSPDQPDDGTPLAQVGQSAYPPFQSASSYSTQLDPMDELAFRQWVSQNNVPFNPDANAPSDYDMRGYFLALKNGNPQARPTEVNPNDNSPHYTDYFKTPLHQSFSSESQFANANSPQWVNSHQLAAPNGRVVFDELPSRFAASLASLGRR